MNQQIVVPATKYSPMRAITALNKFDTFEQVICTDKAEISVVAAVLSVGMVIFGIITHEFSFISIEQIESGYCRPVGAPSFTVIPPYNIIMASSGDDRELI